MSTQAAITRRKAELNEISKYLNDPELHDLQQKLENTRKAGIDWFNANKADKDKIAAYSEAIKVSDAKLGILDAKMEEIKNKLIPFVGEVTADIYNERMNLKDKSAVGLIVNKWQIQNILRDLKFDIQKFYSEGLETEDFITRAIEKFEDSISTVIGIYDKIQDFQTQITIAEFIGALNLPSSAQFGNDIAMQKAYDKLQILLKSNIFLSDYDTFLDSFKMSVFPFAHRFLGYFEISNISEKQKIESGQGTTQDLDRVVETGKDKLKKLGDAFSRYKSMTDQSLDTYIHTAFFEESNSSSPFYTWRGEESQEFIHKLLRGEEATILADVLRSPPG
ncbi:unnamed protein product, partial [Allacma fusca]